MPEVIAVTAYTIRDVPLELWSRAKQRAAMERRSLRDVLIALLSEYVAGNLNPPIVPKGDDHAGT